MSWWHRARAARWVHFLALPLAGFDARVGPSAVLALARGVLIAFAVLAFGYLLNALADRRMDRPDKNAFASGSATASVPWMLAALVAVALLATASAPACARVATAVCLASGVVYSTGPRLKRFPVVGSLANITNFVPLLWAGESDGGGPHGQTALAVAFTCMLLQNQLIHEAADREEDLAGGVRTSVLWLGTRRAALVAAAVGVGVLVAAARLGVTAWPLAIAYVVAFPVALARAGDDQRAGRLRLVHRAVSVAAGAALFVASISRA